MGSSILRRTDHVSIAGDTLTMVVTADGGLTGATVRCTVKRFLDNGDVVAIAQHDTVDGGVEVDSDTQCTATFAADETDAWPIGKLWYDVQAVSGALVITIARGFIDSRPRATITHLDIVTQTLPRGFDTTPGNNSTPNPFGATGGETWQWHYDSAQFDAQRPISIREIAVRPDTTFAPFSLASVEIVLAEASTNYTVAGHVTTFAANFLRSEVVRDAAPWSGAGGSDWLSLDITRRFDYDPSTGNDFIIQIRKCGGTETLLNRIEGQFAPGGTIGGNWYGHTTDCDALVENFRGNQFVPIVRIIYS